MLNKSTRFTIFVLNSIFLITQILFALSFVIFIIFSTDLFRDAKLSISKNGHVSTSIMDTSNYNFTSLNELQFLVGFFIICLIACIVVFFLCHYLRAILQNVNENEIFSQNNLKIIRRIILLYVAYGIINFATDAILALAHVKLISGVSSTYASGLIQTILTTAGIYTLYFVFKYGVHLKKDNEAIV